MSKLIVFIVFWVFGCFVIEKIIRLDGDLLLMIAGAVNYIVADAVSNQCERE